MSLLQFDFFVIDVLARDRVKLLHQKLVWRAALVLVVV